MIPRIVSSQFEIKLITFKIVAYYVSPLTEGRFTGFFIFLILIILLIILAILQPKLLFTANLQW